MSTAPERKGPSSDFAVSPPQLSLPKGGGAIRGIDDKFTANPVTGTASLRVPLAISPARSGFEPTLDLTYDSGAGNGPFGVGWTLSLPQITLKTDKGLPRYRVDEESDVYLLSGVEDLVAAFKRNPDGTLFVDARGAPVVDEERRDGHAVRRYRPRSEGLFARIERWIRLSDGDTHWRSISKDNVLTVYGATMESRIADPARPARVFSWLVCQSYDDKGNAISYSYAPEDDAGVDRSRLNERLRVRSANRYLKSVRYGNRTPLLVDPGVPGFRRSHLPAPDFSLADWMFELVFDYGEGHYREAAPDAQGRIFADATIQPPAIAHWTVRADPFSSYRSCFEVRTYRLCQRALLFHHFSSELAVEDCLVRSTEFTYRARPTGSLLIETRTAGFKRVASSSPPYLKRSLPPLACGYSTSPLDDLTFDQLPLLEMDAESLAHLPAGVDGRQYRWVDLNGEGIAGVMTEAADAWFYKRNLGGGRFGPVEALSSQPSLTALGKGRQQLLDLEGDGRLELVDFAAPTPGFFSRTEDGGWERFRPFESLPDVDWRDANLRFVDLTGDGHADVLITEDQAYSIWFESHAANGFGSARHVTHPLNDEDGPRLVFAGDTDSVYLADMSGDGLADLVRIRNGEVCYWPNLGYGRFGAKVSFNNAPWFDDAESFDQRRLHLADTDGSGPTDILYAGRDGVRVYLNEHGNGLSDARLLLRAPRTNNHTTLSVVDLLGRGTACLVWSSTLPGDSPRPLRYIDLMGGVKPHLLTSISNNLGAERRITYASSTEFYLADRAAATPWITRLPFPVHVVSRVETRDAISGNQFVSTYTYHHGYFDGSEREFRGFGRVEQRDTETFGAPPGSAAPTNRHPAFDVPPILTKTWFHTGAFQSSERISRQFAAEYYREEEASQAAVDAMLLDDTVLPAGLDAGDWREATRSLKGAVLRQETYALDETPAATRPYVVSERNYTIALVQPRTTNRHAVFFTHRRETVDFHYERALFAIAGGSIVDPAANPGAKRQADPRVTHDCVLDVDHYGNVRRSMSIGYGRRFDDPDPSLTPDDRRRQRQPQVTLTESTFTNVAIEPDAYRTPMPAEVATFELLRLTPPSRPGALTSLWRFDELATAAARASDGSHDLPYEDINGTGAVGTGPARRPIERSRNRYRSNTLAQLLPLGTMQSLALPGEHYRLALTPGLLNAVYQRPRAGQPTEALLPSPALVLKADGAAWADRGGYVDLDGDGHWWIPSGRLFFHPDAAATPAAELAEAAAHFFVPRRFRDPFGHDTRVDYAGDLLPIRVETALGNVTLARPDYRVLKTAQLTDPNGNRTLLAFDALGLPVALALCGKPGEVVGDSLDDFGAFDADPSLAQIRAFAAGPQAEAPGLLKSATTRFVYDVDRFVRSGQPPFAATLSRETHASEPAPPGGLRIQTRFVHGDGLGRELQSKIPAEPGEALQRAASVVLPGGDVVAGPLARDGSGAPIMASANPRWVGKGRTIFNNKGKPIKQYEPFFSSTHLYEPEPELTETGVTPILFYDPLDRIVATLHPNHSYEKVVFDPWKQTAWDANDTVAQSNPKTDPDVGDFFKRLPAADYLPTWFEQRRNGQQGADARAAAEKAAAHANTPSVAHFDALGRPIVTVADNGVDASGVAQKFATRLRLDIEGNRREVIDAKERVVLRDDFDLLGNTIAQFSMDAGRRWMLSDASGQPLRRWDAQGRTFRFEYDETRRSTASFVLGGAPSGAEVKFDVVIYGDSPSSGLSVTQQAQDNLRGRIYRRLDTSGALTVERYDFRGNVVRTRRQCARDYQVPPDWAASPVLMTDSFVAATRYDALNRPVQVVPFHRGTAGAMTHVQQSRYNEAGLLEAVDVWLNEAAEPTVLLDPVSATLHLVAAVEYSARGQRTFIRYGNGAATLSLFEPLTFRPSQITTTVTTTEGPGTIGRLLGRVGANTTGVFQDLRYTYDPVGNVTLIRDQGLQTVYFDGQAVAPVCEYTYDATYRLTSAAGREHIGQTAQPQTSWDDKFRVNLPHPSNGSAMRTYVERYEYDAVGNFERLVHRATGGNWTRTYAYDEASPFDASKHSNRVSRSSVGALVEPLAYDAHGNITAMPHLTAMRWDFIDRLSVTSRHVTGSAEGEQATYYLYDADGQRRRKVSERLGGGLKNERIYLGDTEVYREFAANGSVTLERETLRFGDDRQTFALVENRSVGSDGSPARLARFQFANHLGSSSLELDDAGRVISYEEYYPYGSTSYQALNRALTTQKRYRFTGKERDDETGLNYHGARYLATWLGRWIACEPTPLADGPNPYAFVRGAPSTLVDTTGLDGWGWLQNARESARDSATGQAILGAVYGTQQAITPLGGFAPSPPGATKAFEVGRGLAQLAVGIAEAGGGASMITGGASLTAGAAAGEVVSLGSGTLVAVPAAAVGVGAVVVGVGVVAHGGKNVIAGATTLQAALSKGPSSTSPSTEPPKPATQGVEPKPQSPEPKSQAPASTPTAAAAPAAPKPSSLDPSAGAKKAPPNPHGAKGKPSTQAQNQRIGDELEGTGPGEGYKVTGGAGRGKEEYIAGPGGKQTGSVRVDVTAKKPGDTVRVQTVDTRGKSSIPDKREMRNAGKIIKANRDDGLFLIPK